MMRSVAAGTLLIATLQAASAAPIQAGPLPQWAVGDWVATTVLEFVDGTPEEAADFARVSRKIYAGLLPKTRIAVHPHSMSAAPGGALTLVVARHADARIGTASPRALMHLPHAPSLFGAVLPYDLEASVASAQLEIRGCAEQFIQGQVEPSPVQPTCRGSYTLLRFPTPDRLAIWQDGGYELYIYERARAPEPASGR